MKIEIKASEKENIVITENVWHKKATILKIDRNEHFSDVVVSMTKSY